MKKKSNRPSRNVLAENPIQTTAAVLRKARIKGRRERGPAITDVAVLEHHAELVREAGANTVTAVIETGRRLIAAKEKIAHGEWETFIDKHLRWAPSTVSAFMKIAERFGDQSSDIVRALPGDQRTLVDLARVPTAGLKQLVKKHEGSLAGVPRAKLRDDIKKFLPAPARKASRSRKAPPSAPAGSVPPSANPAHDDAFDEPMWLASHLLLLLEQEGGDLTAGDLAQLRATLEEIRATLDALTAPPIDVGEEHAECGSDLTEDEPTDLDEDGEDPDTAGETPQNEDDDGDGDAEGDPAPAAKDPKPAKLRIVKPSSRGGAARSAGDKQEAGGSLNAKRPARAGAR